MIVNVKNRETSDEYFSLAAHADELLRHCEGALPWPDKVLMALDHVCDDSLKREYTPVQEAIEAAIALFVALPESEQRRICHGWAYKGPNSPTADFLETLAEFNDPAEWVLRIRCHHNRCESVLEETLDGSAAKVQLVVRHGTSKRAVLDALSEIESKVRTHFEEMIVNEYIDELR